MKLNNEEINRYSRHLTLPEVGMAGQLEIKESRVLMIGAGGLGSPLGMYLGAVGVGKIGLVDFDVVDHTNLHRQIAHTTADEGRPKVESLRDTILAGNPNIEVEIHNSRLERDNVLDLFSQYDIIADGSDNFETRYLINDAAFFSKKPLVSASIFRFQGQTMNFELPPHRPERSDHAPDRPLQSRRQHPRLLFQKHGPGEFATDCHTR